jgi:hypothetical protein
MSNPTARLLRSACAAAVLGATALGLCATATAATGDTARPATVYGDPAAAAPYWSAQTLDDCALMSVADVVGQITGDLPSEEDIVGLAATTPSPNHPGSIYLPPANLDDPNSGMGTEADDLPVLLSHFGIDADLTDDCASEAGLPTGMTALEDDLAAGKRVIAFVNSETIWDVDGDRSGSDHALVVTAVDTAKGIVHLNDSGTDDGCDEQVPLATFEKAWVDHGMLVTA